VDFSVDVTVHSASSDSFVLGNKAIQLTVAGGRITSLFDVRLRSVSSQFAWVVDKLNPFSDARLSA
jgi:hypothetical protein